MKLPVLWPTSKTRGIFLSVWYLSLMVLMLLGAILAPFILRNIHRRP